MDIKDEDMSEESRKNHIAYYKSLANTIAEIQTEKDQESDPTIHSHLDSRIEAMEKDQKRIRDMFPDIKDEELNNDNIS